MEYDSQSYDGIKIKTGTMSGSMICNEQQYQNIPYKAIIGNRTVLITVVGRQSVCIKCGQKGHQRATCPDKTVRKSYTAATRG